MNQDDAKKILGMAEGDADVLGNFTRRKKLITERLDAASSDALKAQYKGMLSQLEQSVAVLIDFNQQLPPSTQAKKLDLSSDKPKNPQPDTDSVETDNNIDLKPGQTLAGRYKIRKKIGRGSNGIVFRAYDTKRREDIAIKVFYPERLPNTSVIEYFLAGFKLSTELYHPNIVNEFDVKNDAGYYFLTMELLKGRSLRQLIDARKKAHKPFSKKEIIHIANIIAGGLAYAHIKMAHQNIKPENIWIDEKGIFKIMDFGTATLFRADRPSQMSGLTGTDYLAPEQFEDSSIVDDRADQYALGVIVYELFTFKTPPRRKNKARIRHRKINRKFASLIRKMMQFNAADRFDAIDQIKPALSEIDPDRPLPEINRKALALATLIIVAGAGIGYAISSGQLSKLMDYMPLSADVEQHQFNEAIELVKDINELTRRLSQNQKRLHSNIRETRKNIRILELALRKTRIDSKKIEIEQQLDQFQTDFAHNQRLQSLTEQVIYPDRRLSDSDDKVRAALALVESKKYLNAIELLKPLQDGLKLDLLQFSHAEDYLKLHKALNQAQMTWQDYNQSQNLLKPENIEQRTLSIIGAEHLAEKGQLVEAIKQIDQYRQDYVKDHLADQQHVEARSQQRAQQARTQNLEKEWQNYLKKQRLKISAGQRDSLAQNKVKEQIQLARQEFKEAQDTSRYIQQLLTEYYTAAKARVTADIQKRAVENDRKAKADYEKAVAAAKEALVEEDYNQAIKQYKEALSHNPKDTIAGEQLKRAVSKSSSEMLKKYAPGLILVKIPSGNFRMGHLGRGGSNDEKPQHKVTIKAFNLMKHELTFAQYEVYLQDTGKNMPDDEGWGRDDRPVINVNWNDASAYARWLSQKTGYRFRLPSEAEWEYAARANSNTAYSWGDTASHEQANYGKDFCCDGGVSGSDQWFNTSPAGSFPVNRFGVNDMYGNVWEWVQDCWNTSYNSAPNDGSAWLRGNCSKRVLRGGSWSSVPGYLRSANRDANAPDKSNNSLGFRLLQEP